MLYALGTAPVNYAIQSYYLNFFLSIWKLYFTSIFEFEFESEDI